MEKKFTANYVEDMKRPIAIMGLNEDGEALCLSISETKNLMETLKNILVEISS